MWVTSVCGIMTMVILVGLPRNLLAETPIQALQVTIERLQHALRDPSLAEETRAKQVWDILLTRFNLREMAKRILGSYWERPVEQQEAFLAEFTAFLKRTFSHKLETLKESTMICRAEEIQGSVAKVMTSLYLAGEEVKLKFHMHQPESEWKIYDVLLDQGRFSLVSSYRAQLQWLLHTSSFEELLQVMRAKNAR